MSTENRKQSRMNFFKMIERQEAKRIALLEDGIPCTYGELTAAALRKKEHLQSGNGLMPGTVFPVQAETIGEQLILFLAVSAADAVPLLVPGDLKTVPNAEEIPEHACMAVMTSGSTGAPKVLYRRYESWADYFPVQNEIFGIDADTRLFAHGSLAFTGNLNLYMGAFFTGAMVIAENKMNPRVWEKRIREHHANAIYLIPSKLRLLPKAMRETCPAVRHIISGSESLGREEAAVLKQRFPEAEIILYYGASELNYITYVTDREMGEDRSLVGKPFPQVEIFVDHGEIFVNTAYHVEGIQCPYSLSDTGYLDDAGNLYFSGRSDDIVNIHGRKISTFKIQKALELFPEVEEAAVVLAERAHGKKLYGYVICSEEHKCTPPEQIRSCLMEKLRERLAAYELPARIVIVESLPRNESGKVNFHKLK